MSISGLVITLAADTPDVAATLAQLDAEPSLTVGAPRGHKLPAVLEAESDRAARDTWDRLRAMPGVMNVDVVYIHFDDPRNAPRDQAPPVDAARPAAGEPS